MANPNEMKDLCEDIETSFGERMKFIAGLANDTAATLKAFHQNHQEMGEELRSKLAAGVAELKTNVGGLLGGFHADLLGMGKKLRGDLASETSDRKAMVVNMLSQFQQAHQAMSDALHAFLAKDKAERKTQTAAALADRLKEVKDRSKAVKTLLGEFREVHRTMAELWQQMSQAMNQRRSTNNGKLLGQHSPEEEMQPARKKAHRKQPKA